jgi:hypothetical protein
MNSVRWKWLWLVGWLGWYDHDLDEPSLNLMTTPPHGAGSANRNSVKINARHGLKVLKFSCIA